MQYKILLAVLSCLPLARGAFGSSERGLKALLFWAVDSANRTQQLVKKNIAYARKLGGRDCCDVVLAHYEGTPDDWGKEWYASEVTSTIQKPGYKFKFLKDAFREEQWQQKYEFVWALDSDIDFTNANLVQLFQLARSSGSLIVGPTFSGEQAWKIYDPQLLRLGDDVSISKAKAIMRHEADAQAERQRINILGKPDPRCMMRHTDFVEMTAPLLHASVLSLILRDCEDCIHDKAEWGLDRVWCEMASEKFSVSACSLIDATPVIHLDWQTAQVTPEFKRSELAVKQRYPKYWATVKNIDCMLAHKQKRVSIDEHGNLKDM
eukprot:gb/GFBE01022056.1/.p1 GENE.gb/GFBE01022056.1/~~gb/GFBE01022056.1/.p1  ORF type:complete len:321 (+),score=66.26 gb/GFBE01022056.1/:1-963(+)